MEKSKEIKLISEKAFVEKCLKKFPKFIKVGSLVYKQVSGREGNSIYTFTYVSFDGSFCKWEEVLCDFNERDYKEVIHYVEKYLKTINYSVVDQVKEVIGKYLKVDKVLKTEKQDAFYKELCNLLNRYSIEAIGGDTPDFLLADYLIKCIENFGMIVDKRTQWYKGK